MLLSLKLLPVTVQEVKLQQTLSLRCTVCRRDHNTAAKDETTNEARLFGVKPEYAVCSCCGQQATEEMLHGRTAKGYKARWTRFRNRQLEERNG